MVKKQSGESPDNRQVAARFKGNERILESALFEKNHIDRWCWSGKVGRSLDLMEKPQTHDTIGGSNPSPVTLRFRLLVFFNS